jgi:hypothetical protein
VLLLRAGAGMCAPVVVLYCYMPLLRAGAGSRPGGRGTFLCFAKEGVEEIYFNRPNSIRACASHTHAAA